MKQFVAVLLSLGMAFLMSCSKDDVEEPVEPIIPGYSQELTGEFEGEWSCDSGAAVPSIGKIDVESRIFFIDEIPTKTIIDNLVHPFHAAYPEHPEIRDQLNESIGDFFFASSYEYQVTDLQFNYKLDSYSDGYYFASISYLKNQFSYGAMRVYSPELGRTVTTAEPEPDTVPFRVEADGVKYRIDMITNVQESNAEFNMKTGMWTLNYWFSGFKLYNLYTGQNLEYSFKDADGNNVQSESHLILRFNAAKRTGNARMKKKYW